VFDGPLLVYFLLLYNGMNHFDIGKYICLHITWASLKYKTPPNLK